MRVFFYFKNAPVFSLEIIKKYDTIILRITNDEGGFGSLMGIFKNMSFRAKLLLTYIAVIILCIIVFGLTVFSSFSNRFENEIEHNTSQVSMLAVDNMTNSINNIEQVICTVQANTTISKILSSPGALSPYEEIAAIENEIRSADPLRATVSTLRLYIANNDAYPVSFDSAVASASLVENESWYKRTIEKKGDIYWGIMDTSDTNGVLCVARAFIDTRTHEVLGVIRADVNLSLFTNDISKITLGHTGRLFIVYENHIINTWNDSYINGFVNEPDFFEAVYNDITEPQIIKINGVKHIVNKQRIKTSPIILVCASNYEDINTDTRIVGTSIITTGIIAITAAVLLMFLLTGWLTAPITNLNSYMKHFETERKRVPDEMLTNDEMGKLCATYNTMLDTIDSLINDVYELYQKQKLFELKALQAQINPHFLYNTLDSINWMARAHNARDISKMVSALGTFFRHSLNKGNEYTTIENELKQIESYTDIQKVRYDDKFDIKFDLDKELLQCTIIKLTVQPLVENCIIHGFEDIEAGGMINVRLYAEDDYIYISVADNGCGTDTDALNTALAKEIDYSEPIEKYGLSNVNLRIKLYFDETCGLTFSTNEKGGVTALIKIRRKKHEYKTIDL